MADRSHLVSSRYARLAPAAASVAGALHVASGRMGLALEHALAAELLDAGRARPWGALPSGGHRFAVGSGVADVLAQLRVPYDRRNALADLWFMSSHPDSPSFVVQVKSGGRLGKAQRVGEALGLSHLAECLARVRMPVRAVLCAFDAQTDRQAQQALGCFPGLETWCGPSLCLALGVDYDRIHERWCEAAGDPGTNDEQLVGGLYDALVAQYGQAEATRIWSSTPTPVIDN